MRIVLVMLKKIFIVFVNWNDTGIGDYLGKQTPKGTCKDKIANISRDRLDSLLGYLFF